MAELSFETLERALAAPRYSPRPGGRSRIQVAQMPTPFVKPSLEFQKGTGSCRCEVIFVSAQAAVGKSTAARFLSAVSEAPVLDLSRIPVSTGTLRTLLLDMEGPSDPVPAFLHGEIPIIVDAIDEGRLRSGETGIESFLQTNSELLLEHREHTERPKLIFFGRYDSIDLAKTSLQLYAPTVTYEDLSIGFFGREAAWMLIDEYAKAASVGSATYSRFREPAQELIQAYFDTIAAALKLDPSKLWAVEQGRAFAGYAPVLGALGTMIAKLDNYQEVTNKLRISGASEAWAVIESVIDEIFVREQGKLADQFRIQNNGKLPDKLYNADEQALFLSQYIDNQPLQGSGKVSLTVSENQLYQSMVQQYIPEHPFVRQRTYTNAVLGSVVTARAMCDDAYRSSLNELLLIFSRQPFLWRSAARKLTTDVLLDGDKCGFLLNSFWNDPLTKDAHSGRVRVQGGEDTGAVRLRVPMVGRSAVEWLCTEPVVLRGGLRHADVSNLDKLVMEGSGERGGGSTFHVDDSVVIVEAVELRADRIRLSGKVWLEATTLTQPPHLQVDAENASLGYAEMFGQQFPWKNIKPDLKAPYADESGDSLTALVTECTRRFPPGVTLVLSSDYRPNPEEQRTGWLRKHYSEEIRSLVEIAVRHGLANADVIDAAGSGKSRIRFAFTWDELLDELVEPGGTHLPKEFMRELRSMGT